MDVFEFIFSRIGDSSDINESLLNLDEECCDCLDRDIAEFNICNRQEVMRNESVVFERLESRIQDIEDRQNLLYAKYLALKDQSVAIPPRKKQYQIRSTTRNARNQNQSSNGDKNFRNLQKIQTLANNFQLSTVEQSLQSTKFACENAESYPWGSEEKLLCQKTINRNNRELEILREKVKNAQFGLQDESIPSIPKAHEQEICTIPLAQKEQKPNQTELLHQTELQEGNTKLENVTAYQNSNKDAELSSAPSARNPISCQKHSGNNTRNSLTCQQSSGVYLSDPLIYQKIREVDTRTNKVEKLNCQTVQNLQEISNPDKLSKQTAQNYHETNKIDGLSSTLEICFAVMLMLACISKITDRISRKGYSLSVQICRIFSKLLPVIQLTLLTVLHSVSFASAELCGRVFKCAQIEPFFGLSRFVISKFSVYVKQRQKMKVIHWITHAADAMTKIFSRMSYCAGLILRILNYVRLQLDLDRSQMLDFFERFQAHVTACTICSSSAGTEKIELHTKKLCPATIFEKLTGTDPILKAHPISSAIHLLCPVNNYAETPWGPGVWKECGLRNLCVS